MADGRREHMARTIPQEESLTVEFKSDRKRLPDTELVATVVCLANTDGGEIFLGVEDDGQITGVHAEHQNLGGLAAMVANRTSPPISVRVEVLIEEGLTVARIEVPRSFRPVATSDGLLQRRRLQADGTPQCVPFYPHEILTRQSDLGMLDHSAMPVVNASGADLDPLERERLRQLVERYGGDRSLLPLSDEELDGALGFVRRVDGRFVPTITGMLMIGRESALRDLVPTHEVAFQVLSGTDVRVNDFYRTPLLKTFERVLEQFTARVEEHEITVGLFRVPIPNYDRRAFREAFVNALVHRDYSRLSAVHVRWSEEGITISNPGGFVEGVSVSNLLVTEPRPRNPSLADAVKRIGLAERTGRGVDLIYQGLLRYGRPAPDYAQSTAHSVVVVLPGGDADVALLKAILEEERRINSSPLPVDALITLSLLRHERRVDTASVARATQRDESAARRVIERLVESGLVEAHGVTRGRTYTLSSRIYREFGQSADYVRQVGFEAIQQEQMVLQYVRTHGRVTRRDVIELCRIGDYQATRLLDRLVEQDKLVRFGAGRGVYYEQRKSEKPPDMES